MLLNPVFFKLNKTPLLLALVSLLLYISFAYDLIRTDYIKLVMLYGALWFLFYKLVQFLKTNIKLLTWLAFGLRAIFILAIPNLSQDFYRFIWDGRMLLEGFNPYLFTVDSFISKGEFPVAQAQELYNGMGTLNASHFTNYPPINQLCFVIAGLFTGKSILGSVVIMRLLIIIADFGTLYFGKKLLTKLKIPAYNIFWYILNPFIIIELTGNLHFEGVMIFFLVWSLYLLHIGKWQFAAIVLALSVSVKLIPLIFLPLLFQKLDWKKSIGFYLILGSITLLLFAPFYASEFINNYTETVALWFQNFEFNASIYYIAREIGYSFRGYNEIAIIGKMTPIVVIFFVLIITFFRKNKTTIQLITAMLLVLSFYYFTTTTVHPWYIATLLILSVFTKYKFPLVWSIAIILSYLAYINVDKADKSENLWVIALEYLIVYSVFVWEVFLNKKKEVKKPPLEKI
ncbi:mannosyltransferase [Jejuia spongiicola]|uniref:Mannosyltransferase n=1 Tax=Jejuia spongiicola TaxID=2942207 RepID=A0ABT0QC24_9FLAO|nr:mannosyltransferase [Jejuia spongiicola]MCL6294038.1 mannosyltransferase [Jejuia spongiicola]